MEITRSRGLHQHGLNRAIIRHLREKFPEIRVDLKFDGYKMPVERPLIVVETMQNNNESISKQREAMQTIYRYQIGLFDANSVQLSINQERLQDVFNFEKFTFYDTLESPSEATGYFLCDLTAVVPMPNDDVSKGSNNHRVYFDIEIEDIKRRW